MTIREAKLFATKKLQPFSPSASLDVNCLLEHIFQCDKTFLLLHANDTLTQKQEDDFHTAIEKRKIGLPIAYITNHKEFYGYDFYVTPDVLIPKPDTEILVENAVAAIVEKGDCHAEQHRSISNLNGRFGSDCHAEQSRSISNLNGRFGSDCHAEQSRSISNLNRRFGDGRVKICDMCAGSGCIGLSVFLSLKEKLPEEKLPEITFVDISETALQIAKKNAERLAPECFADNKKSSSMNRQTGGAFHFIKSNLFENITDTFDFILTNPPYIPSKMVDELLLDGRNEPRLALDGDAQNPAAASNAKSAVEFQKDGLGLIRRLIPEMRNHLNPNGAFFMETGEYNAEEASKLCGDAGFKNVKIIRDLEGQLRMVTGN